MGYERISLTSRWKIDTVNADGNHEKLKLFNLHGYCIFSQSSIFMTSRENNPINMLAVILKVISTNQTIGGQDGKEIKI